MVLKVNDVGDGNFIQIFPCECLFRKFSFFYCSENPFDFSSFTIDCGSVEKGIVSQKVKHNGLNGFLDSIFLLSHYHTDHYNGLLNLPDHSTEIQKVYYPFIPKFIEKGKKEEIIGLTLFSESLVLGKETGCPAKDLLELIRLKNKCDFTFSPLKQGDTINFANTTFHVIWPPETIDTEIDKPFTNGLKEIYKILEENPELKELWEEFNKHGKKDELFYDGFATGKKHSPISKDELESPFKNNINEDLINELSQKVRTLTNRFSICLYAKEKFLFLGDLEKEEINKCLDYAKEQFSINHIDEFIAPHHGTHWEDREFDIYAHHLICSNGSKMSNHFNSEYLQISGKVYQTYTQGDIVFYK